MALEDVVRADIDACEVVDVVVAAKNLAHSVIDEEKEACTQSKLLDADGNADASDGGSTLPIMSSVQGRETFL